MIEEETSQADAKHDRNKEEEYYVELLRHISSTFLQYLMFQINFRRDSMNCKTVGWTSVRNKGGPSRGGPLSLRISLRK